MVRIMIDTSTGKVHSEPMLTQQVGKEAVTMLKCAIAQVAVADYSNEWKEQRSGNVAVIKRPKKEDFDFSDPERVNAFLDQLYAARKQEESLNKQENE